MTQGFEPIGPMNRARKELEDHFSIDPTREQEERARQVHELQDKKPSLWKRLFRRA